VPKRRPAAEAQGGRVEGLRQGRGEGQLGSIVLSEFLNPPLVLVDRLLNSGYLVHERRPRRAKLRDALVVGLMPHEVRETAQGAFAKACWADCMARLAHRLVAARLQDSEFRWIEGDAAGRVRDASFPLGRMPLDVPPGRHAAFRDAFLTLSRLVPDYFETRAGFRPLPADIPTNVSADEWAIAAWAACLERGERAGSDGLAGSVGSFSFVHVMVFHPPLDDERSAAAQGAERLGRLRAALRLGFRRRRQVSVTYVGQASLPGNPARDTRPWHFGSDSDPYRALTPGLSEGGAALARALQSSWLARLTRDIWHG
jgi:hypothetical protein